MREPPFIAEREPAEPMATRFSTRAHRLRSLLVFAVFVLLVVNMLGLVDFEALLRGQLRVNAGLLEDFLRGDLGSGLARPDVLGFLACGAVLTLALPNLAPLGASALTAAAMLVPFAIAWYFPAPYPLVPLEYGLLAILLLFAVNVLAGYFVETHEKHKVITLFGQYVPPALIGEIARRPADFSLAGEARELTVLFCDVKGFTAIAETLAPDVLAEMLNHYLTAMTDVLHHHGATIDKYIGDAVMAFWGAPFAQPDHAARAVGCALAMQARMQRVRKDCAARGWPELEIGIGIASGPVSVGNMGSRYRVAYTVIGDVVNLAARLEGLTRLYGVGVLVSPATCAADGMTRFREIDHVRVKGKAAALRIYEPLAAGDGNDAEINARLADHARGLAAYYAGDWHGADLCFAALATPDGPAAAPADWRSYYVMMRARMRALRPPRGWDGVVSFGSELRYSIGDGAADAAVDEDGGAALAGDGTSAAAPAPPSLSASS